jgi:TonB family protein
MASITKESGTANSAQSSTDPAAPTGTKPQPTAAEIPVTVNGARTLEGSDKREPFSENTKTVLVFASGAVIRLSSPVASGQLLFLTNEKTKKEVVCQVVKSKNQSGSGGYVELEFTEAAPAFWGLRFPASAPATSVQSVEKPISPVQSSATASLQEKMVQAKTKAPAAPATQEMDSILNANESNVEPAVSAPSFSSAPKIPTLSEFLTQGASGPALKSREKLKSETPRPRPESTQRDEKPSPEQPEKRDSLSSLLIPPAPKENPAPGASSFDFGADEVKIPAWLEPLARNSAVNVVTPEMKPPATVESEQKSHGSKISEVNSFEASGSESGNQRGIDSLSAERVANDAPKREAAFTFSGEGSAPNFGSSFSLDTKSASAQASRGLGKGLILGLLSAGLLLAAGGSWYWYSNQPKAVSANATAGKSYFEAPAASNVPATAAPASGSPAPNPSASRIAANPQTMRSENRETLNPANVNSKPVATANDFEQPDGLLDSAIGSVRKPSLGKVHLAKPTRRRISSSDSNLADAAPALSDNGVAGGDADALTALATKGTQPASPLPVGGNVKPARLLSSVAPVYPQLARSQRLSGDVKIDASIGENGHVSTMKVISGPALLHQAAMDAVRQWKYQPATLNGQPMSMHLTVTVQFKLLQ